MKLDLKEFAAGLAIALFGVFAFVKAFDYGFGTPGRVGPGSFPALVGALTIVVGLIVLVPAFGRIGALPKVNWRAFLAVSAGVAVFALSLSYLGFVPAVFFCVCLCSVADPAARPVPTVITAAATTLAFWLIFILGLQLQIPAFGGAA
jgi:hypothetical protein